jgi:hypothetical protein
MTSDRQASTSRPEPAPAGLWVLLAWRFLLELGLLAAVLTGTVRLVGGLAGWVVGALAALLVALVWGLFLSPRRRIDSPVGVRVVVELALFVLAALLLAASGLVLLAVLLLAAEAAVLILLRGPDRHAP